MGKRHSLDQMMSRFMDVSLRHMFSLMYRVDKDEQRACVNICKNLQLNTSFSELNMTRLETDANYKEQRQLDGPHRLFRKMFFLAFVFFYDREIFRNSF